MKQQVDEMGFAILPGIMGPTERAGWLARLGPVAGAGRRGLLSEPHFSKLARSGRMMDLIRPHLQGEPMAVRAIYFDKNPDANWLVPWHQDLTLALQDRAEVPGFGPWSIKEGICHVQPPVELLEQMIALRLHLDAADGSNGALRVLPGSHDGGRLSASEIQQMRRGKPDILCPVSAGDVMLIRPLLLHASGRSVAEGHRRVLHIEYAGFALPAPLRWHEAA